MNTSYDQLKIEYSRTDRESNSVRLMCLFLVIIFAFVPLAEFVTGLEYHQIESYPQISCVFDLLQNYEVLSFKPIN